MSSCIVNCYPSTQTHLVSKIQNGLLQRLLTLTSSPTFIYSRRSKRQDSYKRGDMMPLRVNLYIRFEDAVSHAGISAVQKRLQLRNWQPTRGYWTRTYSLGFWKTPDQMTRKVNTEITEIIHSAGIPNEKCEWKVDVQRP